MNRKGVNTADQTGRLVGGNTIGNAPKLRLANTVRTKTKQNKKKRKQRNKQNKQKNKKKETKKQTKMYMCVYVHRS